MIANAIVCLSSGTDFLYFPVSTIWEVCKLPMGSDRKEERKDGLQSNCAIINSEENKQGWNLPLGTGETEF